MTDSKGNKVIVCDNGTGVCCMKLSGQSLGVFCLFPEVPQMPLYQSSSRIASPWYHRCSKD